MIYLDSDFLIHALVLQEKEAHRVAKKKLELLDRKGNLFISLLTLQEVAFVLGKLKMERFEIEERLLPLQNFATVNYLSREFDRAKELASKVGFENINDCLHTAIAEKHCKELYTFNRKDFEKIKAHTDLKLRIF